MATTWQVRASSLIAVDNVSIAHIILGAKELSWSMPAFHVATCRPLHFAAGPSAATTMGVEALSCCDLAIAESDKCLHGALCLEPAAAGSNRSMPEQARRPHQAAAGRRQQQQQQAATSQRRRARNATQLQLQQLRLQAQQQKQTIKKAQPPQPQHRATEAPSTSTRPSTT